MGLLAKISNNTVIYLDKDSVTMTNAETIKKLNDALNTLINAYELLQEDNNGLKNRITELEDEVLELETVKEDLENNVTTLHTSTEEDNSNINSMLGKIESLLTTKVNEDNSSIQESTEKEEIEPEVIEEAAEPEIIEDEKENTNSLYDSNNYQNEVEKEKTEDTSNKIDLNRMASLLNGFNN